MHDRVSRLNVTTDQRGAILIHVALSLFALMAMSAFVIDYGLMWMSRRQAQNAADAGALAGATGLAYDSGTDFSTAGPAYQSALLTATTSSNWVFGEQPGVHIDLDPSLIGSWDHTPPAQCLAGARCVQVDVYRDGTHGSNTLPVYFAALLGQSSQATRATATAMVAYANTTLCMRPFAVADKWLEQAAPSGEFDRWVKVSGNATELNPHDVYIPPSANSTGTGYTVANDFGTEVTLKNGQTSGNPTPGWFQPIDLPDGSGGYNSGGSSYNAAIEYCVGQPVSIGQYLPTETGDMNGPTKQGISTDSTSLVNQDPNATWNTSTNSVENSCAPGCAPYSPRIVPIAIIDMDEYQWRTSGGDWTTAWTQGSGSTAGSPGGANSFSCPGGGKCVRVTNILGFFVEGMSGNDVLGRLVMDPGDFRTGTGSVTPGASFLVDIQLIR